MQLDYQEFNFFMDRYKQVVFGYITNDLYEYADILDVKAGPFKDVVHYNLSTATGEMEVVHEQVGTSKYDNLNNLIASSKQGKGDNKGSYENKNNPI